MRKLIRALADEGKAVFLCSHLLHEVQQVCDRLAIVSKGRLIREAGTAELLGTSLRLTIEARPMDAALKVLETRRPIAAPSGHIAVEGTSEEAPAIVRELVAAGVDVFRIAAEEQNLEKVFLEMTSDPDD
jgi:ABC-2 type transport system ATP-binding protein